MKPQAEKVWEPPPGLTEAGPLEQALWRLRALLGDPIPTASLAFCFDQMAVLLATGMSLPDALQRAARSADPEMRRIADAVAPSLQRGARLSQALAPWRNRFPEIVLPVLEVGEESGTMEGAARRLASAFQLAAGIERKFRTAVYNPWLIILGLTLFRSITHLVPDAVTMLTEMVTTFLELGAAYLVARVLLRVFLQWQALRMAIDTVKLALPHAGTIFRNLAAARWARSFVTLWNSGVAVSYALEVSSRSALNARYERALLQAARQTRQGRTLRQSLAEADLLPRHLLDIIGTGEESGQLGAALERFVTLMEEEAYTRAVQEFMLILTAGQILLIVIAVVGVMR
jgi:type IV pilus assembly protein PilC